jgi:hypothetical protein
MNFIADIAVLTQRRRGAEAQRTPMLDQLTGSIQLGTGFDGSDCF